MTKIVEVVGIVGRVGDIRELSNNNAVVNFSVASTERRKQDDGTWVDVGTIWTNCQAWGRRARHIHKTFKPGDRVFVRGEAKFQKEWTDKDGNKHPASEKINADIAGHENFFDASLTERKPKKGGSKQESQPAVKQEKSDDLSDIDDVLDNIDF